MKLQSNNLLESLTRSDLKILTTEVKETLASNFKKEKKRIFSAAEYWDLQRRRKNLFAQRNYFWLFQKSKPFNFKKQKIMKLQSNNLLGVLTSDELINLTTESKETLCSDFKNDRKRIFSAAQLWNIQRSRKNVSFQKSYL